MRSQYPRLVKVLFIVAGVLSALIYDKIKPGCRFTSNFKETITIYWRDENWTHFVVSSLLVLLFSVALAFYIKPLSKTGAYMTGLCGFALVSFFLG